MNHHTQGRLAQVVGDNFESWIDTQHETAMLLGILAHIYYAQAKTKVIGGRLTYVGKGVADYVGTLMNSGRALALEAKSTAGLRLSKKVVKKKQALHLDAVAAAGGLALLLAEFRSEGRCVRFAVPWLEVPWVKLRSAESVCAADLMKWKIELGQCYLSRFCPPGVPGSVVVRKRVFPRE